MKFYRYEPITTWAGTEVHLCEFVLLKETKHGYWIIPESIKGSLSWLWYVESNKKWIPKESKKRYAYPTKEQALVGYIKRSERRIKILKGQLSDTISGVSRAKYLLEKLQENE